MHLLDWESFVHSLYLVSHDILINGVLLNSKIFKLSKVKIHLKSSWLRILELKETFCQKDSLFKDLV